MIINNFLKELKIYESTSDFLIIQQNIVDFFKENNSRNIITKLFNNYKDFCELVKGNDSKDELDKKKKEAEVDKKKKEELDKDVPPETAMGRTLVNIKKQGKEEEEKRPNLEAAVAILLNRLTGEKIELDLDRYYTVSGRKKSDILSDQKMIDTISDIKKASISDEKKLLMPLFQVNIKLDEYLSNKKHMLSIPEKQKVVLGVFWILLIDGKYIPSDEKLEDLFRKYGQQKSFKNIVAKRKLEKRKKKEEPLSEFREGGAVQKGIEAISDKVAADKAMKRFRTLMKTNVVNPNGIDILDKTNNVDRDVLKKLEKEGFIENKKLGWYRITMDGKMELKRLQKLKPWR